jgi:Cu/Ag efflux pump CusA
MYAYVFTSVNRANKCLIVFTSVHYLQVFTTVFTSVNRANKCLLVFFWLAFAKVCSTLSYVSSVRPTNANLKLRSGTDVMIIFD